jgi:hypothetical protein
MRKFRSPNSGKTALTLQHSTSPRSGYRPPAGHNADGYTMPERVGFKRGGGVTKRSRAASELFKAKALEERAKMKPGKIKFFPFHKHHPLNPIRLYADAKAYPRPKPDKLDQLKDKYKDKYPDLVKNFKRGGGVTGPKKEEMISFREKKRKQFQKNQVEFWKRKKEGEKNRKERIKHISAPHRGYKKGGWIQSVNKSIKKRGTKGKCTPITKKGCTGRAKALAMTFKKMARKRKG